MHTQPKYHTKEWRLSINEHIYIYNISTWYKHTMAMTVFAVMSLSRDPPNKFTSQWSGKVKRYRPAVDRWIIWLEGGGYQCAETIHDLSKFCRLPVTTRAQVCYMRLRQLRYKSTTTSSTSLNISGRLVYCVIWLDQRRKYCRHWC